MTQDRQKKKSRGPRTAGQWITQIIGELFITVGLVLLLFVGWQLWWTNIAANQTQEEAVQSLAREFAQAAKEQGNQTATGSKDDADKQNGSAEGTDSANQDGETSSDTNSATLQPGDWDPNNPPEVDDVAYGHAFGIVYIPRFGASYQRPAAEGVGTDVLDTLGLGHYPGTAMPGEKGNFALAGHRQTNGAVLDYIEDIQIGDHIYVQTLQGYYTYTVYETKIVLPTDVDVIAPNPDDPSGEAKERLLTLTTCHPRYGDTQRYIVHAKMESWQPLGAAAPQEIAAATNL